jgi:iron complex outermembrane receptor protein
MSYAYLENRDASTVFVRTQYSRHSGAVGLSYAFREGWRGSIAYYAASGDGEGETHYGRKDLTLTKAFSMRATRLTTSLIVRHLDNRSTSYFRLVGNVAEGRYNNNLHVFARLQLTL